MTNYPVHTFLAVIFGLLLLEYRAADLVPGEVCAEGICECKSPKSSQSGFCGKEKMCALLNDLPACLIFTTDKTKCESYDGCLCETPASTDHTYKDPLICLYGEVCSKDGQSGKAHCALTLNDGEFCPRTEGCLCPQKPGYEAKFLEQGGFCHPTATATLTVVKKEEICMKNSCHCGIKGISYGTLPLANYQNLIPYGAACRISDSGIGGQFGPFFFGNFFEGIGGVCAGKKRPNMEVAYAKLPNPTATCKKGEVCGENTKGAVCVTPQDHQSSSHEFPVAEAEGKTFAFFFKGETPKLVTAFCHSGQTLGFYFFEDPSTKKKVRTPYCMSPLAKKGKLQLKHGHACLSFNTHDCVCEVNKKFASCKVGERCANQRDGPVCEVKYDLFECRGYNACPCTKTNEDKSGWPSRTKFNCRRVGTKQEYTALNFDYSDGTKNQNRVEHAAMQEELMVLARASEGFVLRWGPVRSLREAGDSGFGASVKI